jgi:hypothetical protein
MTPLGSQDLTVALRVVETLEDLGISYHPPPGSLRPVRVPTACNLPAGSGASSRRGGQVRRRQLRKLLWYRIGHEVSDRQWSDIQRVLKTQGEKLDRTYLRHWAEDLQVADLLEKALSEAGQDPSSDH